MQKKQIYQIIAAAIIILIFGFLIFKKEADHNQPSQPKPARQNQPAGQQQKASQAGSPQGAQTLAGTLQISDNLQKGNLMIVTAQQTLYIFTSRDFSGLISQPVTVTYTGTSTNFVLEDITAK